MWSARVIPAPASSRITRSASARVFERSPAGTSTERDRAPVSLLEGARRHLALAAAELPLARALEELRDRRAGFSLEDLVRVDHLEAGVPRAADGPGLARPHEADQDERGPAV